MLRKIAVIIIASAVLGAVANSIPQDRKWGSDSRYASESSEEQHSGESRKQESREEQYDHQKQGSKTNQFGKLDESSEIRQQQDPNGAQGLYNAPELRDDRYYRPQWSNGGQQKSVEVSHFQGQQGNRQSGDDHASRRSESTEENYGRMPRKISQGRRMNILTSEEENGSGAVNIYQSKTIAHHTSQENTGKGRHMENIQGYRHGRLVAV